MRVGINKTGQHGVSSEIDLAAASGRKSQNLTIGPHCYKPASADGCRLSARLFEVSSPDVSVVEDKVRLLRS
jgi:hypothetical protein